MSVLSKQVLRKPENHPLPEREQLWCSVAAYRQKCDVCYAGAAGCFLGAQHQYLAILANDGMTVSVYDLAKIGPSPTAALVLDTSSTGAVNIFPGPDPLPQPTYVVIVIGCFDCIP